VQGTLDDRIDLLEDFFDNQLSHKMSNIEYALERSVTSKLNVAEGTYISKAHSMHEDLKIDKGAWMIPFLILLVLMIGAGVGLYLFYARMRKIHLL